MLIKHLLFLITLLNTFSCSIFISVHELNNSIPSVERPISQDSELGEIQTAAPNVLVLVLDSPWEESEYIPDTNRMHYRVNESNPGHIYRYSRVNDQLDYDYRIGQRIFMRHLLYLEMEEDLRNGVVYEIETPYGSDSFLFDEKEILCPSIKVSQGGYSINSSNRYAVLGIFLGDGGTVQMAPPEYHVLAENSSSPVYTGTAEAAGFDEQSGEYTYKLDLSPVNSEGRYFIYIENMGRSYGFDIDNLEDEIYTVFRGLYHQRCGIALTQPYTEYIRNICHTQVAFTQKEYPLPGEGDAWIHVPPGTEMHEIHGGYHDAGDFDRRAMHTLIPIFLLHYYEMFPENFTDNQFNLPESGNGIPDFLDEALWGVKLYEYLQLGSGNSDENGLYGAVMTGTEGDRHPTSYGGDFATNAANDDIVYGTYQVSGHATASACGMFAHAARLLEPYDSSRSEALLNRAKAAWDFLENNSVYRENLEAQLMYASLQMYLATASGNAAEDQDNVYHQRFRQIARGVFINQAYGWPREFKPGYLYIDHRNPGMVFSPYFAAYLKGYYTADSEIRSAIEASVIFYADSFEALVSTQIYPVGRKAASWAANTGQGWTADVMCLAYELTGDSRYYDAVAQLACHNQGLNALGKSYIIGVGEDQVNSPLHLDSWFPKYGEGMFSSPIGNVPGITVYGPTTGRSGMPYQMVITEKLYPYFDNMPVHRRWSDGWSLVNSNEFTTWEILVINACMFGFLGDSI